MSELYKRLVELCESRGITGYRMCKDCKLSPSTMTDIKSGRKKTLNAESASRVAEYFGVSVPYLYGQETKKSPSEDEAIKELATILLERPDLRGLLDVAKVKNPEDVEQVTELLKRLRGGG